MKLKLTLLLPLFLTSQSVLANQDIERLVKLQCSSCHGNEVYTRPDRKVKNLVQLEKQLQRCNHVIGNQMDKDTVTQLMNYLNRKYYKF